jgi:CxxC motif-containing protein (DUF1111 family)
MSASKVPTACRRSRSRCFLLLAPLFVGTALAQPPRDMHELDAIAGKALFERSWVTSPASTAAADGLGPYYDARSCAACHPAAAAGPVPDTLVVVLDDAVYGRQLQRHAVAGLPAEALVHFHTEDVAAEGFTLQRITASFDKFQFGPVSGGYSLRRPPALSGVALFDDVSDTTLQQLADPLDANGDGISGRMAGRYGWKADVDGLGQQVARAFSVDMGISNPVFPENSADCTRSQHACLAHSANTVTGSGVEADQVVVDLVVQYLESLPPPGVNNDDAEGEAVFTDLGCPACHVPELATSTKSLRAWTDLLLHDMGEGLAVGSDSPDAAGASEWRTAPLWGLAQRQAWLHDGRARTVEEAILWHGGEAAAARQNFANAGEAQRQRLQAFLLGL